MWRWLAALFPPEPPANDRSPEFGLDELLALRRSVEDLESRHLDLKERFDRFQNREGMRRARSDRDLAAEAAEILARTPQGAAPVPAPSTDTKQALRERLAARRRH